MGRRRLGGFKPTHCWPCTLCTVAPASCRNVHRPTRCAVAPWRTLAGTAARRTLVRWTLCSTMYATPLSTASCTPRSVARIALHTVARAALWSSVNTPAAVPVFVLHHRVPRPPSSCHCHAAARPSRAVHRSSCCQCWMGWTTSASRCASQMLATARLVQTCDHPMHPLS